MILATSVIAQSKSSLVQRINEIKGQSEIYYWDQYTHPDADTAKINAIKRVLMEVNIGRSEDRCLTVDDIMPYAKYINIDRGNLKQYFVYVKKDEASVIKASPMNSSADGTSMDETPVVTLQSVKPFVPDAFVQRLMETEDFTNVYKLLKSLQSQGKILQFGKLRDVEDYSTLDLILFDIQSQKIVTMLSPVTVSGMRTNVVNGMEDSLDNYPTKMTAVIWYIKK